MTLLEFTNMHLKDGSGTEQPVYVFEDAEIFDYSYWSEMKKHAELLFTIASDFVCSYYLKPEFTLEFADMGPYDEINRLNRLNTSLQDTVNTLVRILDVFTKVKQFNWIPMSEKQPTVRGHYLVTAYRAGDKSYEIETDYWDGLGEFWECWGEKVLAWAELPEPYTGDNDDHQ